MKLSIPDLEIEVMGDIVLLQQGAMSGEANVIEVHRIHLAHIAEIMDIVKRPDLERDIERMGDGIVDLRNGIARLARLLDSVPTFPPGRETEDVTTAFELLDMADSLCDRFGLCVPLDDDKTEPQRATSSIPETQMSSGQLF